MPTAFELKILNEAFGIVAEIVGAPERAVPALHASVIHDGHTIEDTQLRRLVKLTAGFVGPKNAIQ